MQHAALSLDIYHDLQSSLLARERCLHPRKELGCPDQRLRTTASSVHPCGAVSQPDLATCLHVHPEYQHLPSCRPSSCTLPPNNHTVTKGYVFHSHFYQATQPGAKHQQLEKAPIEKICL